MQSTDYQNCTGERFGYNENAVGNREAMTVTTLLSGKGIVSYTYDSADRLMYVGGVALIWDNNGNLLADHEGTDYAYDTANRLTRVVRDGVTYIFTYSGAGDWLSQSVGGAVTTYTLDLNGGLTQVLGDGASVYLYGLGRIGEEGAAGWVYHLGDALGSVRQLADGDGAVVLDRSYRPYGGVLEGGGSGESAYGFAGEWTDGTGLVFLRARYVDPRVGRFVSRDLWEGDYQEPLTLHLYLYVLANPINRVDPRGLSPWSCINGVPDGFCSQSPAGIDPRDLTQWLYSEMMTNLDDPRLQKVRQANKAGDIALTMGMGLFGFGCVSANPLVAVAGGFVGASGLGVYYAAYRQFYLLVGDRQLWNFKHSILDHLK